MIQIDSLSFGYNSSHLLFQQLDLQFNPGRIHGLFGKNGAGKTTLLKLICGLVSPISGTVRTNNYIPNLRQPQFLSDIYLLAEEVYLPANSATDLVKLFACFYPCFDLRQFKNTIRDFDVDYGQKFSHMSLGQKKKIAIAFALSCNTNILMLDEPTNGLDIPSKAIFRKLIASLFHEDRIVLISTHQVHDVQSLIDTVTILHNNKVSVQASLDEIASKYTFYHGNSSPEGEILYTGKSVLGNSYIVPNLRNEAGEVDVEAYFNAVVDTSNTISQHTKI